MKPTSSSQNQRRWDEEIIKMLRRAGSLQVEYPPELFTARRAALLLQVQQQDDSRVENDSPSMERFIGHFESLKFARADYPPELLAARRAAFIELIEQHRTAKLPEGLSEEEEILRLLQNLKSVEVNYPPNLMAVRRAAFKRQAALTGRLSILEAIHLSLRSLFQHRLKLPSMPTMEMMRTALVVTVLLAAVFVGSRLVSNEQAFNTPLPQTEIAQSDTIFTTTSTADAAPVVCKPGYVPPLCLVKEFDKSQDLSFVGNGTARPAVAKDTLPGYSGVHKSAYVNDGLYGPGASWISNSPNSWIKIDLGKTATINTVAFGRDRLGNFNDRDPGQFIIAVALSDNVYEDGNSSNDYTEYTEVFDSEQVGFDGTVSGSETVKAQFEPVVARFVKIIFANAGTAVDEVEVFMDQLPKVTNYPTREPSTEDLPGSPATSIPSRTPLPIKTVTPVPTNTPLPVRTATPVPTDTPLPTDTPVPPTNTPVPTHTAEPEPTDTSAPPPPPTDTSVPPTEFVEPLAVPTEETLMPVDGF